MVQVVVLEKVMVFKFVQSLNASYPILISFCGKVSSRKLLQFLNARPSILVRLSDNATFSKLLQFSNAPCWISTPDLKTTVFKAVQLLKALGPNHDKEWGSVIDSKPTHPSNA